VHAKGGAGLAVHFRVWPPNLLDLTPVAVFVAKGTLEPVVSKQIITRSPRFFTSGRYFAS
jgi:hypothetical protein